MGMRHPESTKNRAPGTLLVATVNEYELKIVFKVSICNEINTLCMTD